LPREAGRQGAVNKAGLIVKDDVSVNAEPGQRSKLKHAAQQAITAPDGSSGTCCLEQYDAVKRHQDATGSTSCCISSSVST
jgi:hypothetical protein